MSKRNGSGARAWDTPPEYRAGDPETALGNYFPGCWSGSAGRIAGRGQCGGELLPARGLDRRMGRLVHTLGITTLSKSQVSEMARSLDAQVQRGRTVNVHRLLATGVNAEGYREVLGLQVSSAGDGAGWLAFFRDPVWAACPDQGRAAA